MGSIVFDNETVQSLIDSLEEFKKEHGDCVLDFPDDAYDFTNLKINKGFDSSGETTCDITIRAYTE